MIATVLHVELRREHRIDIIISDVNDRSRPITKGEPLMFRCAECGNADETLAEIRHDEDCSLAGRHGRSTSGGVAIADGGDQ